MSTDLTLVELVTGASVLVQLVMLLLVAASFLSWMRIVQKRRELARARAEADAFEERFWASDDLAALYSAVNQPGQDGRPGSDAEGLSRIFHAGFKAYAKLRGSGSLPGSSLADATQRAMRVSLSRQTDQLERYLSFLATVGSVSPYIGLFGTVWGIMNAFRALGNVQQATIALVAPGIAEALVATAIGLFAAIPAVIAYNRFQADVDRLYTRYDNFIEEFVAIVQRQVR